MKAYSPQLCENDDCYDYYGCRCRDKDMENVKYVGRFNLRKHQKELIKELKSRKARSIIFITIVFLLIKFIFPTHQLT